MIAMQYSFVLPADYDMDIIDRRIAERGHFMDGFPGLTFKAYLCARKQEMPSTSDNLYAPFYLWHTTEGMNEFLCGPGFFGLTQSFGWPSVRTWLVWHMEMSQEITQARYATREMIPINPHADLAALRHAESERSAQVLPNRDLVATVTGFEPTNWSLVRFKLWRKMPDRPSNEQAQIYDVAYVSPG